MPSLTPLGFILRPGGGYAVFAGKEVSRALGLMSLEAEDCCGELADLTPRQLEVLDEWVAKFRGKYHVVGRVSRHSSAVVHA
jgi:membrane-associated progesterone receptor component